MSTYKDYDFNERINLYYAMNTLIYSLHHILAQNVWEEKIPIYSEDEDIAKWVSDDNNMNVMISTFYAIYDRFPSVLDIDGKQYRAKY